MDVLSPVSFDLDLLPFPEDTEHPAPSSDDDYYESKKPRKGGLDCEKQPGRNALIAKANRERKKAYVSNLEGTIKSLEATIKALQAENSKLRDDACVANKRVDYLTTVIQNESALGKFLASVGANASVPASPESAERSPDHIIPLTLHVHLK
eukprot:m.9408 g.9408  ORF g.9408 m.9408 type:complete len:152 (+) comp2401_c0_seq1:39-494(+)